MVKSKLSFTFFFCADRSLQSIDLLPSRSIASSGFPPLRKIPCCCLPKESGPCLSPNVAIHSLKLAMHHCLGRPLPYQLANTTYPYRSVKQKPLSLPEGSVCGIN